VGEGTESPRAEVLAAHAEVLAARTLLAEEIDRLEASARAAVDVKAKVRKSPVKTGAFVAGTAFVVAGGPRRVFRGVRNAVFGKPDPMPKSMLPKEIDSKLRELGSDGERVRGLLEREFASYLDQNAPARKRQDVMGIAGSLLTTFTRFFALRYGRLLAEEIFKTDAESFANQIDRVRARRAATPKGDTPAEPG